MGRDENGARDSLWSYRRNRSLFFNVGMPLVPSLHDVAATSKLGASPAWFLAELRHIRMPSTAVVEVSATIEANLFLAGPLCR